MTLVWFCGFSQPHYAEIPPPLFQQMRQYLQMLNPKIKRILKKKHTCFSLCIVFICNIYMDKCGRRKKLQK